MKYNIVIALIVLAFTACKKEKTIHQDSHDLAKDTSVALLTRIVYNTNDSLQGKLPKPFHTMKNVWQQIPVIFIIR